MQLPLAVSALAQLPFAAASAGLMSYHGLNNGAATLLAAHGSDEQKAAWLPRLRAGDAYATMCLSEPHAGSCLTDLYTTASPRGDGTYAIDGTKMWITGGDHGLSATICHLVLARLPDAPVGHAGISLFLVPKHAADGSLNGVRPGSFNKKMGQMAATNCEMLFENAVGTLVGAPHGGLLCMFVMMNELRCGVGMGSAGTALAGYRAALNYARDRPQGRHVGADPASPMVPIVEHADVKRMLLVCRASVAPRPSRPPIEEQDSLFTRCPAPPTGGAVSLSLREQSARRITLTGAPLPVVTPASAPRAGTPRGARRSRSTARLLSTRSPSRGPGAAARPRSRS